MYNTLIDEFEDDDNQVNHRDAFVEREQVAAVTQTDEEDTSNGRMTLELTEQAEKLQQEVIKSQQFAKEQEVKQEAFKITWPTKKDTVTGSLMVFVLASLAAVFFLLLDQILKFFLNLILLIGV